jgi:hypothetical protein
MSSLNILIIILGILFCINLTIIDLFVILWQNPAYKILYYSFVSFFFVVLLLYMQSTNEA